MRKKRSSKSTIDRCKKSTSASTRPKPGVRTAASARTLLKQLVAKITEENRHELVDWGPPTGEEIW